MDFPERKPDSTDPVNSEKSNHFANVEVGPVVGSLGVNTCVSVGTAFTTILVGTAANTTSGAVAVSGFGQLAFTGNFAIAGFGQLAFTGNSNI